ncbi:MAG: HAD-IA family hydrolase [Planctomycetaceae bacterium]
MSRPQIEAVIFDCDGTLVDSETLSLAVLVESVAELGLVISLAEAMERFAGNELSVVFSDIEQRMGRTLPADFLDTFRSRQIGVLREHLQPVPGVHALLESLALPFCVASNAPLHKVNVCLETAGLMHHFQPTAVFSAYQINSWKPAPDLFLLAAESLQVAPERCAVVEDSVFGIRAGLAAGMQVFGFDPHLRLSGDFPDVTFVTALHELHSILNGTVVR